MNTGQDGESAKPFHAGDTQTWYSPCFSGDGTQNLVGQLSTHTTRGQAVITSINRAMEPGVTSANKENQGRHLGRGDICGMNRIANRWKVGKGKQKNQGISQPINT